MSIRVSYTLGKSLFCSVFEVLPNTDAKIIYKKIQCSFFWGHLETFADKPLLSWMILWINACSTGVMSPLGIVISAPLSHLPNVFTQTLYCAAIVFLFVSTNVGGVSSSLFTFDCWVRGSIAWSPNQLGKYFARKKGAERENF